MKQTVPPLLRNKSYGAPSVFTPENLLREARRQKRVQESEVPRICLLDPDGDFLRTLCESGHAQKHPGWPCYHTDLYTFDVEDHALGIIGCAVGASFAVLVTEELFASGCELLLSITSSGQIIPKGDPPYFVLIDRAIRDEGTSYHYLPPSDYAELNPAMRRRLAEAFVDTNVPVYVGSSWTTDAPFRETDAAIESARQAGVLAVEVEAAALYAFAAAREKAVVCFAHVTNQMAQQEGDFEKGEASGSRAALEILQAALRALS